MAKEARCARLFAFLEAEYAQAPVAALCADLAAALVRAVRRAPEGEQCAHVEQVIAAFLEPLGYRRGAPEDGPGTYAHLRH